MTKSDWINVVVAIGVVATAMFTAMTALAAHRQTRLLLPVVHCSAERQGAHAKLFAGLHKEDQSRHFIAKITLLRPWRGGLVRTDFQRDSIGGFLPTPASMEPRRSLSFDGRPYDQPIAMVELSGRSSIKVRFDIALRADSSRVRRFTTSIKIKD